MRPERGDELLDGLAEMAESRRVGCARVTGWGVFEDLRLERVDPENPSGQRLIEGPVLVPSIVGTMGREGDVVRAQLFVTAQAMDAPVAGLVTSGTFVVGEIVVEAFDDADPVRVRDRNTGLVTLRASRAQPDIETHERAASAIEADVQTAQEEADPWAAVAKASEAQPTAVTEESWAGTPTAPKKKSPPKRARLSRGRRSKVERSSRLIAETARDHKVPAHNPKPLPKRTRVKDDSIFDDPIPERGSFIEHAQLGRCLVLEEDREGDLIIRLPSGRQRALNLDAIRISGPEEDGDEFVYRVRPKGARFS